MKTCKKLLAIALVAAVLLTTLVSGLVVSAADANTLVIGTTEIVKGTATADVEFTLTYAEATKAPHSLCTITADEGLTLTALTLGAVDYVKVGDTVVDDELVADAAKITIDDNGKNIAAGKVLFESAVDSNAPTVNSIKFVATFAVADPDAIAEYNVTAAIDATNYDEADVAIDVTAGKVSVVEPPHVCDGTILENNGDGTHAVKCECGKVVTAAVACTYVDGFCACGAEEPVTGPVVDDNVEQLTHSIAIGETFGVVFKFKASTISADYASYSLEIKRTYNGGGYNFAYDTTEITNFNKIPARDTIQTPTIYGFELYSLTAPVELTWHFFDANGVEVAYSTPIVTSLADVAVAYHDSTESSEAIKKVMADMIQVGAAALNHFTSNKTKNCDYSTLPLPTIESQYITTELGDLTKVSSSEGLSVKIAGALSQSAYFNLTFSGNVANKEDYRFVCKYYNAMSKKNIEVEIDGSTMKGNATTIMASLSSFPLFSTNQDVTFELYKVGETDPIAVNHYSMEQYYFDTLETSSNATLKALITELAEMAQSIRTARKL